MDLSKLYAAAGKTLPAVVDTDEERCQERALRLVVDACAGLNLAPAEALQELGPDREQLARVEISPTELHAFCRALECSRTREAGQRPDHYTQPAFCAGCGPVWLWASSPPEVLGCPWCLTRAKGCSIPRPETEARELRADPPTKT